MKNFTEHQELGSAQPSVELKVTEQKTCKNCKKKRSIDNFYKEGRNSDGFGGKCKDCLKIMAKRVSDQNKLKRKIKKSSKVCCSCKKMLQASLFNSNKSTADWLSSICKNCASEYKKQYYKNEDVKDRESKRLKEFAENNKKHLQEYRREYYSRPEVKAKKNINSINSQRRQRERIPSWENLNSIKDFYMKSRKAGLEVDHIVPINSELVCGLHCVDNFQLLTRSENARKGNRLWPDMP